MRRMRGKGKGWHQEAVSHKSQKCSSWLTWGRVNVNQPEGLTAFDSIYNLLTKDGSFCCCFVLLASLFFKKGFPCVALPVLDSLCRSGLPLPPECWDEMHLLPPG